MFSPSIRAIAFDLDGTLVDSLTDIAAAANAARAELGLTPLDDARVRSFIGEGSAMLMARTALDDPDAQVDDSALQTAARAHFNQYYARVVAEHTVPYPGAVEGLQALAALGLPLACVTNKPIAFTTPLLAALDLERYFELVLGGDSLAAKKPDPLPLAHVAQTFAVAPAQLLMVGDSHNDVLAARAHGSPVLAVSYGYTPSASALGADRVIERIDQIPALLAG